MKLANSASGFHFAPKFGPQLPFFPPMAVLRPAATISSLSRPSRGVL
jgi:hypothetical protein